MTSNPIRVGIVGIGGWAAFGHVPALRSLPDFELVAISSRTLETAQRHAARFDAPHAFDSAQELVEHSDVDLVAVLTSAHSRADSVRAAITAGKDVYAEWPLTATTTESEELLHLAEAAGVRHIVGLQRRFGPGVQYARDLVAQGHIGELRGVRMSVGTDDYGPHRPSSRGWTTDPENFTHLLSIYGGHFLDVLSQIVGPPAEFSAYAKIHYTDIHLDDTGQTVRTSTPDEVLIAGALERGGLFQVQLEGGQVWPTGLQVDITGTDGFLRITNPQTFATEDNAIAGADRKSPDLRALSVPDRYKTLNAPDLVEGVRDVASVYAVYASDRLAGTSLAPSFADAVRQHRLIDQIQDSYRDSSDPR